MQLRLSTLLSTILCYAVFLLQPVPAHCGEPVLFITEHVPPLVYPEKGVLKGYSIELAKAVWDKMNIAKPNFRVQPWARSIKYFNSKTPTCLFPASLTTSRCKKYRCVAFPASYKIGILAHKKDKARFITDAQLKQSRIITARLSSTMKILIQLGFSEKNFDYGSTVHACVKKFAKGRAPLITGDVASILYNYASIGKKRSNLYVIKNIATLQQGFIFNNAVPQSYVLAFKKALTTVVNSKKGKALHRAYFSLNKPHP
ncbi:transporter substrate-binding domain-containing protein [Halodesulfovibrio sp.]|jgi:ABC-type amino acid transport substrate-binding protein|uniref:substrate-binding periplasmic protein n=1 Tax=Halodesulfovibrio sp. TaxID=1912772 RepID=UPI0025D1926F|nr:transporter substrate-binding domain-containing protein [Halodesulfovibrio sp.]MCT4625735.1 transporter substrate-binding domain-containing protein [Halodesulfovibrio sp.]